MYLHTYKKLLQDGTWIWEWSGNKMNFTAWADGLPYGHTHQCLHLYPLITSQAHKVEAKLFPILFMQKTGPAKILVPGASLVHERFRKAKKSGCSPEDLGARASKPHLTILRKSLVEQWSLWLL